MQKIRHRPVKRPIENIAQAAADEVEIVRLLLEQETAQSTLEALVAEWDELQGGG